MDMKGLVGMIGLVCQKSGVGGYERPGWYDRPGVCQKSGVDMKAWLV